MELAASSGCLIGIVYIGDQYMLNVLNIAKVNENPHVLVLNNSTNYKERNFIKSHNHLQ